MNWLIYENIAVFVFATIGIVIGFPYLRNRRTLYASMIMIGMCCIALGRLYQCVQLWTGRSITDIFQVGLLGTAGAFAFFYSSNYGQFDSLVDDGSRAFLKYRLIATIAPAIIAVMYLKIAFGPAAMGFKVGCGLACVLIAAACYYHLKHVMIPDADFGIVRCLRKYNAVALCLAMVSVLEMIAMAYDIVWLLIASGIGLCVTILVLVLMLDQGVKAWRT